MSEPSDQSGDTGSAEFFSIQDVERETGITKELLRMWERRYGFPAPSRNSKGDRVYPRDQVAKLRLMRRLVNNGYRPAKLSALEPSALEALCVVGGAGSRHVRVDELASGLLAALRPDSAEVLENYLAELLSRRGLYSFIMDFMSFANVIVGDAWMKGEITVAQEHRYSDAVIRLVGQSLKTVQSGVHKPRILLATLPEEQHTLGLLMVEALLRLDGMDVLNLGAEVPVQSLVDAVSRCDADVVALSFSASFPGSKAVQQLENLRFRLPLEIDIWVGGQGIVSTRRSVENVEVIKQLDGVRLRTVRWRQGRSRP